MCTDAGVPGELDLEDADGTQVVGLAGLRHGTERRPAQVEVRLFQARAAGALIRDDDRHRAARARGVTSAFHLD